MSNPQPEPSPLTVAWKQAPSNPDAWVGLKQFTRARIALGRTGGSWQTETLLDFRLAHARARDAVCQTFDPDSLARQIRELGHETAQLSTAAQTRALFLQRPDLGRVLSMESEQFLPQQSTEWSGRDLAIVVSDGLSALAAERQIVPTLAELRSRLAGAGWTLCPIFVVPFARVKLQDQIGSMLRTRQTLMLLGERPGLGSPDSLGAYFTYQPGLEKTDADRTCVSNIRPEGLRPDLAGERLARLLMESVRQQCSGIGLKELPGDVNAALPSPAK
jgi:ethanolamine ammonia-lyase small subunit